tara:strand:+ start:4433 stop:5362 length:930 start_codon:yes stop_codon:yes gene_type:complete
MSISRKKIVKCIFCSGKSNLFLIKKDRVSQNPYKIFVCEECKSGFVFQIPTEKKLQEFYQNAHTPRELQLKKMLPKNALNILLEAERKFPNTTLDAKRICETVKHFIPPALSKKVLDVGAGYGFISRELIGLGYNVQSLEVGETSRKIFYELNKFYPDSLFFSEGFSKLNKKKYDLVVLSQVLEHLAFKKNPIKDLNFILKKNGVLALAFPNFRSLLSLILRKRDFFIISPEHLNYFSKKAVIAMLEKQSFRILKVETVSRFNPESFNKFELLKPILTFLLKVFLLTSDLIGRGMFLNIYAQKIIKKDK